MKNGTDQNGKDIQKLQDENANLAPKLDAAITRIKALEEEKRAANAAKAAAEKRFQEEMDTKDQEINDLKVQLKNFEKGLYDNTFLLKFKMCVHFGPTQNVSHQETKTDAVKSNFLWRL